MIYHLMFAINSLTITEKCNINKTKIILSDEEITSVCLMYKVKGWEIQKKFTTKNCIQIIFIAEHLLSK